MVNFIPMRMHPHLCYFKKNKRVILVCADIIAPHSLKIREISRIEHIEAGANMISNWIFITRMKGNLMKFNPPITKKRLTSIVYMRTIPLDSKMMPISRGVQTARHIQRMNACDIFHLYHP